MLSLNKQIRTSQAVSIGLSLVFALLLSNRMLTPVPLMGYPESINPSAKWMVALAQLAVLAAVSLGPTYRFGSALAVGFAISNLLALAPNGLSALLFGGWQGTFQQQALLLLAFLLSQVIAAVSSYRVLKQSKQADLPSHSKWAATIVVAWGITVWMLGEAARKA